MTTKQPKIELRKVRESRSLSEETPAYSAEIWVNGEPFCAVDNHGQGGPDMHHPLGKGGTREGLYQQLANLEAAIRDTYPAETFEAGGETHSFPCSLELLCHRELDRIATEKTVKRILATKVLWLRDGKVFQIAVKKGGLPRDKIIAHVRAKEPGARFLHDMPLDEATKYLVK
jgi:hypothetical protein